MRRIALLACAMSGVVSAAEARQRAHLSVYIALETERLTSFEQAAESALRDIDISWVLDSTDARPIAERRNWRADIVWGLSIFSPLPMEGLDMIELYTPQGADAMKVNVRVDRSSMSGTCNEAFVSAIRFDTVVAQQRDLPCLNTRTNLLNPVCGRVAMPNPNSAACGFVAMPGSRGEATAWDYSTRLHDTVQVCTHSGGTPCDNGRAEGMSVVRA